MPSSSVKLEIKRKRDLGLQREVQHTRDQHPYPKCRGLKGYDVHWRLSEIALDAVGLATTCYKRSIYNWKGRIKLFHHTCNVSSENIVGLNQILLVFI